jgi:hypothetical protein
MSSTIKGLDLIATEAWQADLLGRPPDTLEWVWPGYLARGALSLVAGQWSTGKSTLVSLLIARMARGGELAGQTVAPARVAVVGDEPLACWQDRAQRLRFGDEVCFFCQPFRAVPTPAAWDALCDRLTELRRERGIDVVIVDQLAAFLPCPRESRLDPRLEVLKRLARLRRLRQAVLVLEDRSLPTLTVAERFRERAALSGCVDIQIEMKRLADAPLADRRRRLAAWSPFAETPPRRLIELAADGRDYRTILEPEPEAFSRHWPAIERLLALAPHPLTRHDLLHALQSHSAAPSPMTLWRTLNRALKKGLLRSEGQGTCKSPFRYHLASCSGQESR